jgi:hypothetical protein
MNELAGAALPSQKFGANAAWLRLNVILYNLLSAYKRVGLPEELHTARPKRLRFLLLNTVGKVVRHARETLLRCTKQIARALAGPPRTRFSLKRPALAGARQDIDGSLVKRRVVVLRELDFEDLGIAQADAPQLMTYRSGVVFVLEDLPPRVISRPPAVAAGIPAGNPPYGSGLKCDAIGHCAPPFPLAPTKGDVPFTIEQWPIPNRRHRNDWGQKKTHMCRNWASRATRTRPREDCYRRPRRLRQLSASDPEGPGTADGTRQPPPRPPTPEERDPSRRPRVRSRRGG